MWEEVLMGCEEMCKEGEGPKKGREKRSVMKS